MAESTTKATPKKATTKPAAASAKPAAEKATSKASVAGAKPAAKKTAAKTAAPKPEAKAAAKPAVKKTPAAKPAAEKKPAAKARGKAMIVTDEQRYRMVAEAAYYRAESNQFKSDPIRDWIEAENDIAVLLSGGK
jgi:hypothetical protein